MEVICSITPNVWEKKRSNNMQIVDDAMVFQKEKGRQVYRLSNGQKRLKRRRLNRRDKKRKICMDKTEFVYSNI